jgi:hypothetical protein
MRRQLETLVDTAWVDYKNKYTWRSSLSHPHKFNSFSVSSLRVNLGRTKKDVKSLLDVLGTEFKDVISSPVRNIHIFARVDEEGLSCGLMFPAESWWDFAKFADELEKGQTLLFEEIRDVLPSGFIEAQHWLKREEIETLDEQQWLCVLRSHKPGQSYFCLKVLNGFEEDAEDFLRFYIPKLDQLFHSLKWSGGF